MTKSKGYRAKTRSLFRRKPRERGKTGLSKILYEYKVGEKIVVKIDPSVHKGMPHRRYHGKIGIVMNKRGRAYVTTGRDEMPKKLLKERAIPIPQVKELLESIGEENLDQFQRRTLDYTTKFSKIDGGRAEELVDKLKEEFELEEEDAVEIINCMPESIEEIRTFLARGRRIVETSKLEGVLSLLNKYRKKE
jgi:large subunit ribosomal protein L21e